ncbi:MULTISPECIES: hypothetical protein [unclassified Moraxella]
MTHFLRIIRGIMLKGATLELLYPEFLAMLGVMLVVGVIAMVRYRKTLD